MIFQVSSINRVLRTLQSEKLKSPTASAQDMNHCSVVSMYDKLRLITPHWAQHPASVSAHNPWYNGFPSHPGATATPGGPPGMHHNGFTTAAAAAVLSASMGAAHVPHGHNHDPSFMTHLAAAHQNHNVNLNNQNPLSLEAAAPGMIELTERTMRLSSISGNSTEGSKGQLQIPTPAGHMPTSQQINQSQLTSPSGNSMRSL